MELYTQLIINGITNGAVYGLLAAGFVLVYRASKALNFAQAGMGAFGAYVLFDVMKGSSGGAGRYAACFEPPIEAAASLGGAYREAMRRHLALEPEQWCAFEPLPEALA